VLIETPAISEPFHVQTGTRVGVAYAEESAFLPWRFSIAGNKWVSKAKGL
jgi:DNA-3-methyladenine glycosylase